MRQRLKEIEIEKERPEEGESKKIERNSPTG